MTNNTGDTLPDENEKIKMFLLDKYGQEFADAMGYKGMYYDTTLEKWKYHD